MGVILNGARPGLGVILNGAVFFSGGEDRLFFAQELLKPGRPFLCYFRNFC